MKSVIIIIKKLGSLLSGHQKFRIAELTVLMIIGGFLETMSVSMILPFMNAVTDPKETMQNEYVEMVCNILGIETSRKFLIFLAVVLALVYIIKNIYLMLEYNVQYRFVYGNMFAMQKRLLQVLINRPYEYFLNINSGEILRIINNDTTGAFNLLISLLMMFTELVVSFMLVGTLFVITPIVTLSVVILLFLLLLVIFVFIKPILRKASLRQQKASAEMNKWLLQSINGIKEVKVMNKEEYFRSNYGYNGNIYINNLRRTSVLNVTPRFMIEGICMGAMFIIIALLIMRGTDLVVVVPMLSAIALAAIRLLPSVFRISQGLTQIAYCEPMVDKVIENLRTLSGNEKVNFSSSFNFDERKEKHDHVPRLKDALIFQGITYRYPNSVSDVLKDASFTIKKGVSVGLIGTSGSGKTTTADIILGLLCPQKGQVLVDGVDIRRNIGGWIQQIGYIPQAIFMLDDTIRSNVAFGISDSEINDDDVWLALKESSLEEFVKELPDGLDTQIGERGVRISGGQRQRIGIARALFRKPEILIFDEATSALDNETESTIMDSINMLHGKKTMIIIAHRLSTIENCDHVFKVEDGKILKVK